MVTETCKMDRENEPLGCYFAETQYGFDWGAAKVARCCSDPNKGWVTLQLETPKHYLQIYVTRTGKVRIYDARGEWKPQNPQ